MRRREPLVLLALLLAACAGGSVSPAAAPRSPTPNTVSASPAAPSPAPEPALRVLVTVETVADLVARVGGDRADVAPLVPSGVDAHTYEPRPQDVVRLTEADAFVGVGLDLNPAIVALAEQSLPDRAPIVLLGEQLPPDQLIFDHVHDDERHSHGDDGHTHGPGHSHGEGGHTHGEGADAGPNPHVWTSVRLAGDLVSIIGELLVELDPTHADDHRARAAGLQDELRVLDAAIAAAVESIPVEARTLVAYHDAWSYFARDYGLTMVTAVQPSDYAEPSAAEVRAVIDLVREHDVPAVFGSEVFPTEVLETIARETGAVYVGELADDVLPGEPGDPDHSYLGLMRRNAQRIVAALGGDPAGLE